MVPPYLQTEGRPLPVAFERFYRTCLRRVVGSRIQSSTLLSAYMAWARSCDGSSINYRQLRSMMGDAGHAIVKSNGVQYVDVAFAKDVPGMADTLPVASVTPTPPAAIVLALRTIDTAMRELARARAAIVGASHEMAIEDD